MWLGVGPGLRTLIAVPGRRVAPARCHTPLSHCGERRVTGPTAIKPSRRLA